MKIFLMRHGTAEPLSTATLDAERPLSEVGQAETTRLADYLAAAHTSLACVWTSPFTRARQTAEKVARKAKLDEVKIARLLVPETNPIELANWLNDLTDDGNPIAVVGHQPSLGQAIGQLLSVKSDVMTIEPATLIELSFTKDNGERKVRLAGLIRPVYLHAAMSANSNFKSE